MMYNYKKTQAVILFSLYIFFCQACGGGMYNSDNEKKQVNIVESLLIRFII